MLNTKINDRMNIENRYHLIDGYLLGQLGESELSEFEELMKDEVFSTEFNFRKEVFDGSRQVGRSEIKEGFKKLDSSQATLKVRRFPLWRTVAAAVALLIATFFLLKINNPGKQDLFAAYYEKLPNKVVPIVRGDNDMDDLKRAMVAYTSGNYDSAKEYFNDLDDNHPEINMYKGIIALEEGDTDEALAFFEAFSMDEGSDYYEEALWYLGLTHLKAENKDAALELFNKLAERDDYYGQKAQSLLTEFNQ